MQRLVIVFLLLCGFSTVQGMIKSPTGFFAQGSEGLDFNEGCGTGESSSDDTSYWSHSSRWGSSSDDWSDVESFGACSESDEDLETDSSSPSVRCLLKRFAARTPSPLAEEESLMQAVRDDDDQRIRLLYFSGADLNVQGAYGTPLHEAIRLKKNKVVYQLLLLGANPDDNNNAKRQTPLHVAVEVDNDYAVEQLFYARANVKLMDCSGYTPGDLGAMVYCNAKIVRLFEVNYGFVG
ncbi:ankyrin repeat domain-containing protein [Candidatus Babeliales bacterium]|nr:ankyrin repeat domain-containing protein [Candidatus Babeliales bacterium]